MSIPLLAIGGHIFEIVPLNLQKIEDELNINWPAIGRFGMGPARQFTGTGDEPFKVEGLCFNHEFGGFEDYLAQKETARRGAPADVIRWGGGGAYGLVAGPMVILRVGATHEMLGPDGIGRKMTFSVDLGAFGTGFTSGGLF